MQAPTKQLRAAAKLGLTSVLAVALAGCGGEAVHDAGELPGTVTITGTAATAVANSPASAIAGAAVLATCARGSGSAMTNADGSFSVTVAKPGVAPCIVQVFKTDNSSLRSIATGEGNFNVTPATELLVQYISAQITSAGLPVGTNLFTSPVLIASNPAFVKLMGTPTLLNHAIARSAEIAVTVPTHASPKPAVPADYLTGKLVARSATEAGNAQNAYLEALRARNTITTAGAVNSATSAELVKDGALPANKVVAP